MVGKRTVHNWRAAAPMPRLTGRLNAWPFPEAVYCMPILDLSPFGTPVHYSELGVLVRGRDVRKRKESKGICPPILWANARDALTNAATCAKFEQPPCFSAKAKEGGRKE